MCFKSDKTSFPIKHRVLPRLTSVSKVPHVGMEYFYVALSWKSSWMQLMAPQRSLLTCWSRNKSSGTITYNRKNTLFQYLNQSASDA